MTIPTRAECSAHGLGYATVRKRLRMGWTLEKSLATPVVEAVTTRAAMFVWLDERPQGATSDEAAEAFGSTQETASSALLRLSKAGSIVSVPDPFAGAAQRKRHFTLRFAAEADAYKPPTLPRKPAKPKRASIPESRAERLLPTPKITFSIAKRAGLDPTAPAIMPKGLRVTKCPSGTDTRFLVTQAPPLFSALAPGSYLPGDSAIARAYAQEQSA